MTMKLGLDTVVIPQEVVAVSEETGFLVRGLGFTDVAEIAAAHSGVVAVLFAQFMSRVEQDGERGGLDYAKLGRSLLKDSPEVVADIIALAADSPSQENRETIRRLPVPVSIEALNKIGRLTFTEDDTLGKMLEAVVTALDGGTKAVTDLYRSSMSGPPRSGNA